MNRNVEINRSPT